MDVLLPTLGILDTSVPLSRQQCLLKASKEAKALGARNTCFANRVQDKETACEEAKRKCLPHITSTPTEVQYLGLVDLVFGKYNGQSFKWLAENDVGYIKYVLDLHIKECRQPDRKPSHFNWIKDLLLIYVELFPQVSCHLEINVDRAIYGQGRFRLFTFEEMWQWYSLHKTLQADPQAGTDQERKMAQEAYCSARKWLVMKEEDITNKSLKRFRQYILDRETPRQDVVPPAATATSSSSGSKGDDSWMDDALLVEALATFERQGDAGDKQRGPEEGRKLRTIAPAAVKSQFIHMSTPDSPFSTYLECGTGRAPASAPASSPAGSAPALAPGLERTSDVTVAEVTLQASQTAQPEVTFEVAEGGRGQGTVYSNVFFWRPVGVWRYSLRCPRPECSASVNKTAFLYRCGYSHTVRQICSMSGWYSMLTEVLACNACRKAAKESEEHAIGRFLAWDVCILDQLSPAHRAVFPDILTLRRGVDKQVIRLMRDRTEGNTMAKVWRQVLESHCEEYLQRKDLYTTLLSQYKKPGKITRNLCPKFQVPPPRRELPCPKLLRKAFLLAEIMSTFGKVLKYDSTKKVKKIKSDYLQETFRGRERHTNVANELGQILISVLTCEESLAKLRPMAEGLTERYRRAGEAPPEVMYVDRGCCRVHGVSSVEQLFGEWTDGDMLVRLDIFHGIHRFDAAVRTHRHPKYALFKSALSALVFAYNKDDIALLVQAIRAGHPTNYASLTDSQIIELHVSKSDLSHYVRRITVGAQETCVRVQSALEILNGAAGMDENQLHLFKDAAAIHHVWENQQKNLECIQDPSGRNMYTITKYVTRNGVRLARYSTVRGSNSLEGFHSFLPNMIPGPHCAAVPFQVYLLAGIARWNSDRESASVKGQKGRKHMVYVSPLVHRLNLRCQELFGEAEEANYRPPAPAADERIGLEYLFSQSSEPFSAPDHYAQARETLRADEDDHDEVTAGEEEEEEEEDDVGYTSDSERDSLTSLRNNLTLSTSADQVVAAEFDPCVEDVCGPNHLPGYQHVQELSKVLVEIALEEGKLAVSDTIRQRVISAWNKLDLHDHNIQQFNSLYSARWGNALFGRTNGDPSESSLVQKLKFSKRYSAAVLLNKTAHQITSLYQRVQQRVTVDDDDELSKLGIPILKINSKCVGEFIRRQETSSATNGTDQGLAVLRRIQSISGTSQTPATELPDGRPHTSRPTVQYEVTPSLAETRKI
ncbi:unnamed protein product [Leuciscus chuanchicus]